MSRVVYDNQFAHMMPLDKCAECGKEFVRRCRRDEWGYWVHTKTGLKLFCCGQCADAFENRLFMESVREVTKTKAFAAYKMAKTKNMPMVQAARTVGVRGDQTIPSLEMNHWKELEYLEAHGWTA